MHLAGIEAINGLPERYGAGKLVWWVDLASSHVLLETTKRGPVGWTAGRLEGAFNARTAIAFDQGEEFAARVLDAVRCGDVVYAAVRNPNDDGIFALVLLTEQRKGLFYTKPISEDMGPAENHCPQKILDLLTAPANDRARDWRDRCRAHLA